MQEPFSMNKGPIVRYIIYCPITIIYIIDYNIIMIIIY